MRHTCSALGGVFALALTLSAAACTSVPQLTLPDKKAALAAEAEPAKAAAPLSDVALTTIVAGPDGNAAVYASPEDAIRAGDTAGLLTYLAAMPESERADHNFWNAYLALDRAADGDFPGARAYLGITPDAADDDETPGFYLWLDAWFLALEGRPDEAVDRHRDVAGSMPGITADLSLAALLEASGRTDEALAVYEALTPTRIDAPEHEFDPRSIVFQHVTTVIVRHALLLQRLGRIDEAKAVYQQLADAEPEQATSYAAAIESLETGKNLDNKALTYVTGFSQSLSDVSTALQQQRYISAALAGFDLSGFDTERAGFDLATLLIDPKNEAIRSGVVDALYEEALFEGAAHVALTAPETSPSLQISAAQALIMANREPEAREAIAEALALSDDDDKLQTLYGALQLSALLNDREKAMKLLPEMMQLAANAAEQAAANGLASSIYSHFGDIPQAVSYAEEARRLDDTHERRMTLADLLGREGRINDALVILRSERLARPNDPYTLNSLGYFLVTRAGRIEEGYRVLARAMLLADSDPYISDSFGWALYQLGDLDRAQRLIEASREDLMPHRHWEIEDHLGDIYWHQGKQDEAREAWQTALDNHPPQQEVESIAGKLADGLTGAAPEKRPLPEIRIDDGEINRRDI
ncbi:tetratricopeptide repeat protein [Hyphomonas sp. WL0036]|uniref:tetratricopeptide repeat protein n=1 Tax=Hyphomonas sediminis TaxID=2866160 RepID=UPI001C7F68B8|nr:tetratricopeptide repeat protein [Hyphomonas sediminis]MBY9067727.1 tetratricopeptide repeat protein [Hyphomonas sediminis]